MLLTQLFISVADLCIFKIQLWIPGLELAIVEFELVNLIFERLIGQLGLINGLLA